MVINVSCDYEYRIRFNGLVLADHVFYRIEMKVSACSVSSTLQNNTKEYGKKFLFDGNQDTCWNSDQGTSQHISVKFHDEVAVLGIRIQFQGGFAAKAIQISRLDKPLDVLETLYPTDTNNCQEFRFKEILKCSSIKLLFSGFTDFYGRIIIYQLEFMDG